jgi:hypothetical protein
MNKKEVHQYIKRRLNFFFYILLTCHILVTFFFILDKLGFHIEFMASKDFQSFWANFHEFLIISSIW